MSFLHDAEGAAMSGAALDHIEFRVGNEAQHFHGLGAHVLRPRVAGHVDTDATLKRREAGRQTMALGGIDDIFVDVETCRGDAFDIFIAGQDQRPFEFQHQPA